MRAFVDGQICRQEKIVPRLRGDDAWQRSRLKFLSIPRWRLMRRSPIASMSTPGWRVFRCLRAVPYPAGVSDAPAGSGPAHRVGRLWKFKLAEVDAWVRSGGADETGETGKS